MDLRTCCCRLSRMPYTPTAVYELKLIFQTWWVAMHGMQLQTLNEQNAKSFYFSCICNRMHCGLLWFFFGHDTQLVKHHNKTRKKKNFSKLVAVFQFRKMRKSFFWKVLKGFFYLLSCLSALYCGNNHWHNRIYVSTKSCGYNKTLQVQFNFRVYFPNNFLFVQNSFFCC